MGSFWLLWPFRFSRTSTWVHITGSNWIQAPSLCIPSAPPPPSPVPFLLVSKRDKDLTPLPAAVLDKTDIKIFHRKCNRFRGDYAKWLVILCPNIECQKGNSISSYRDSEIVKINLHHNFHRASHFFPLSVHKLCVLTFHQLCQNLYIRRDDVNNWDGHATFFPLHLILKWKKWVEQNSKNLQWSGRVKTTEKERYHRV